MNDHEGEGQFQAGIEFSATFEQSPKNSAKEISPNTNEIKALAPKAGSKEITPQNSLDLGIEVECEVGMGHCHKESDAG